MIRRHFITVLGTGNYSACRYIMENSDKADDSHEGENSNDTKKRQSPDEPTPFVQLAVLRNIMPEYMPGDKITVFATQTAEEINWKSRMVTVVRDQDSAKAAQVSADGQKQHSQKHTYGKKSFRTLPLMDSDLPETTHRTGLRDLLAEEFPRAERQIVRIPEGRNQQELDEIFECIYEQFSPNENVYFDFTHGLRNLPMLVFAVVNYAKVLKKIKVRGLYYGAFELSKTIENECHAEERHVPILDMSFCSTIHDWTSAAQAFVKTGNSNSISSLYQSQIANDSVNPEYQTIVNDLCHLTNCLETSRGKIVLHEDSAEALQKESIDAAYKCFKKRYEEMKTTELSAANYHIERLIEYIHNDVKILDAKLYLKKDGEFFEMRHTAIGMAVVKWAMEKNLIQQAFTALSETILSYVCELFDVRVDTWSGREFVRKVTRSVYIDSEGAVYSTDEREEKWVSNWLEKNPNLSFYRKQKGTKILLELPESVFLIATQVANDRNSLNHFGITSGEDNLAYDVLRSRLFTRYEQMQNIIKSNPDIIQ